jgi:hypothetical protein
VGVVPQTKLAGSDRSVMSGAGFSIVLFDHAVALSISSRSSTSIGAGRARPVRAVAPARVRRSIFGDPAAAEDGYSSVTARHAASEGVDDRSRYSGDTQHEPLHRRIKADVDEQLTVPTGVIRVRWTQGEIK